MPYADKEKNDACKKAYAEKNKEAIKIRAYARRKEREALWTPEKHAEVRARRAEQYKGNLYNRREMIRRSTIKSRYGISLEEYTARREEQRASGDLCGLCKQPLGDDAHFDHNHSNGNLREFLHSNCNLALGLLKDSSEMCRLAAEYLERHEKNGRREEHYGNERTYSDAEGAA